MGLMSIGASASQEGVCIALSQSTDAVIASARDSGGTQATTSNSYTAGAWHHAGGVFASATSRYAYLDGTASTESTTSRTPAFTSPVVAIGVADHGLSSDIYMDGHMAEAAAWDVALTTAEMEMLAKGISPLLIRPQNLVLYVPILGNTDPEIDLVGKHQFTVSGATKSAHPSVFYPAPPRGLKTGSAAVAANTRRYSLTLTGVG